MKTVMKKTNLLVLTIITALATTACQVNVKEKSEDKSKVTVNAQMSSAELAEAAEQLVGPYTFMVASKVAKQALEKDPSNIKAQFILKLLKRFEAFRGFHTRIKPYLNAEQLKEHTKWLNEFPNSPMKNYLTEAGKPIRTVNEIQDVIADYYAGIAEFRQFLKDNQDKELDINLNASVFEQEIRSEMYDSCVVSESDDSRVVECSNPNIAVRKLNTSDMIALRQMISGELVHGLIFTGYTLEGIEKLPENINNQQTVEFLSNTKTFGLLRKNHNFNLLRDIGADLSSALKWAIKYQSDLCPNGSPVSGQRRGYLFNHGICVDGQDADLQKLMATLDKALGGITQVDMEKPDGTVVAANVNIFAWSTKPIQNLRQVAPTAWTKCDRPAALADNSLGGLFVDQNYVELTQSTCEE